MKPSSSPTSRKRALSMSDLWECDRKKAKNRSVDDSVGNTSSQLSDMPCATATINTDMSGDPQSGLFHGARNFIVTGSQFTETVNNYHCCPTTSVTPAGGSRPLRPLDARNIDRYTIGKLIHAATARYPSTSKSDTSLAELLKVLQEKGPGEHVITVVPLSTVDFMTYLLSMDDYAKIPSKVDSKMDALSLIDLIFYLLDHDLLRVTTSREGNHRARRLMIKLGVKVNTVPQSVLIHKDDVKMENEFPIAYGGFSDVHDGSYRGNRVAVKRLRYYRGHRNFHQKLFIREALTWRTLSHDYVLPFVGIYEHSGFIHLVSPFMENGTLSDWRNEKSPSASEVEIMILRVAEGVQYLHYEGVIHCDLRGPNVLLDSNLQVRIADFGLSREFDATALVNATVAGHSVAPELFVNNYSVRYTKKTDIYSFGWLYYEVHFNSLPIKITSFYAVQAGKRPPRLFNPPLHDEAWTLIGRLWDQDPIKRPSIDDVVDIMISWRRKSSDCESETSDDNPLEEDDL